MPDSANEPAFTASDALILGLYAFGIGVNVYLVADAMTDGALTRQIAAYVRQFVERVTRKQKEEQQIRKAEAHVVFEAISVVENGDKEQ